MSLDDALTALLKGRGLNRPRLRDHVRPALAEALALPPDLTDVQTRTWLREALTRAVRVLPPDLADTFLTAAGVTSQARLLEERLSEAGERQQRGLRTMRRRLDDAKAGVADALTHPWQGVATAGRSPEVPDWEWDEVRATLDLTGRRYTSERTVRSTRDGLARVSEVVSLPVQAPENITLHVEALDGGTCAGVEPVGPASWRLDLDLPRPLASGELHRYVVSIVLPPEAPVRTRLGIVPLRDTRSYTATVLLGPELRLASLRRLEGIPPGELDPEAGVPLDVDGGAQVVSHTFTDMAAGHRYGLMWTWPTEGAS